MSARSPWPFRTPTLVTGVVCLSLSLCAAARPVGSSASSSGAPVVAAVVASAATPIVAPDAQTQQEDKPAKASASKPLPSKLSRWFEFQTGTLGTRYRYVEDSKGVRTANQWQYTGQFKGRFKFDAKGRASVTMVFATGNAFTGGWNNTGVGTGDLVRMWPLKQLHFAAIPLAGVEASFGGIGFVRGESTEITTYDNDGYLSGERISVKRPKSLYFDDIAFTSAFLGNTSTPAFWDRWESLGESRNYFQYFASKIINKSVATSADYTRQFGVGIFRAAVSAKTSKARVADAVRYEQYVRGGPKTGNGFAVFGEKNITKRLNAGFGFANIDANDGSLNADRFGKGKRIYETMSLKVTPEFSFQLFMGQAVANDYAISSKYRIDIVGSYNALGAIQRHGWLK